MSILVIFVTCADKIEAKSLAAALVEARLVACANVLAPVESHFVWEGKSGWSEEVPVLFKTVPELFDAVRQKVRALHSYATPNITAWEAEADPDFARWVKESVGQP